MHVHRSGFHIDVAAPDPVQQRFARKYPPRFFHQRRQQAKFGRAKVKHHIAAKHPVGFAVQPQIAMRQHHAHSRRPGAAQVGANARHQFHHRIGLGDIVIRPGFQTPDAVHLFGARRQHDDRYGAGFGAQLQAPTHFDAGQFRQHPVQHDQIRRLFGNLQHRVLAVFGGADAVAFRIKVIGQNLALCRFIFDQQDMQFFRPDHHSSVGWLVVSTFTRA